MHVVETFENHIQKFELENLGLTVGLFGKFRVLLEICHNVTVVHALSNKAELAVHSAVKSVTLHDVLVVEFLKRVKLLLSLKEGLLVLLFALVIVWLVRLGHVSEHLDGVSLRLDLELLVIVFVVVFV